MRNANKIADLLYYKRRENRPPAFSPLTLCAGIALLSPCYGYGELYFAPELIGADPDMVADLAQLQTRGAQLPGSYQVVVKVNGSEIGERELRFIEAAEPRTGENLSKATTIHDKTGLMACLTRSMLDEVGVNTDAFPALNEINDNRCVSPGEFIPAAFTAFNFQEMHLEISIPQAAMRSQVRGYIAPERWNQGINVALLNYNISGNTSREQNGNSHSHYINLNSGVNLGAWRFRDYRTWNEYYSRYFSYRRWRHAKTYIQRAIPPLHSQLIVGDNISSGEIYDALNYRGIELATDENMYPESMRGFAPVIRGTALTNAKVTILQNGYTIYQAYVPPGAFDITDLSPVSSSGDLEVTVTEADGSVKIFSVPYSSVPVLQREGQFRYSLLAGRYQSNSSSDKQPQYVQGTLIWGLPHNITAYGGMQYAENYLSGVTGVGLNLGMLGALSADTTLASSRLTNGKQYRGQSYRFLYARTLNSLGTTFQLTGYRYSTAGFHTLDEISLNGMTGWRYDTDTINDNSRPVKRPYTDYYNLYNNRRAKIQVSISQQAGWLGSFYVSGIRQTYWNNRGASDSLQLGLNGSVSDLNYSLSYNYSRATSQPGSDRSVYLSLSMPIGKLLSPDRSDRHELYASWNASRNNAGKISHQATLNGSALAERNLTWSLSKNLSQDSDNGGSLSTNYQGSYGNSSLGFSHSSDYHQVNYGLSGGMILHGEGLTLGQPLGETNILIAAPGLRDVAVENETGIHTDWRGYAIKPYATVYRENRVALSTVSLDDRTEVENNVSRVVPDRGAVVRACFRGYTGYRVLITLKRNGKPLPFGSIVTSGDRSGMVGDDGLVYMSGMTDSGTLQASWGAKNDEQCHALYQLPADAGTQPVVRVEVVCS